MLHQSTRHAWGWGVVTASLMAASSIAGCSTPTTATPENGTPGGSFESDNPNASGTNPSPGPNAGGDSSGAAGAGGSGGSAGTAGAAGSGEAERAIEEADIIQLKDNRLYALSQYAGLSVIDVGTQDQLSMLGRYRTSALPFEMILRDDVVLAMFSSYPIWAWDETAKDWTVKQTSRIVALDTSNPASIQEIGTYDIPGEISDSRVVGDIFYVVAYENGSCWQCDTSPTTTVLSLDVTDPHAIRQIGRLSYQDQQNSYGWYKRSIAVNTERMYVSGQNWNWDTSTGQSTIEVIDISDPQGTMVKGASVAVKGQIESRWQMDEYQSVLRVISQPGSSWSSGDMPRVQTFSVKSAQELNPLGEMAMTLPEPENLQSVRFDGTRAFAVTFKQTDPLFTIDLSDPAQPKQVGELQMPGYLYYMAPKGDRMLALGYDQGNLNGGITVSLFNIADLSKPTMLSRVNFGGDWGWLPEDQDRIHKAFNILEPQGLVLVPFSGWSYTDPNYYCGRYTSGIQLVDFTNDTLTLRGAAPQRGFSRRAFLHNDRLFAVSDEGVNTFDIANRDAPAEKSSLNLAHNAVKSIATGNKLVQLSGDWWTDQAELSVFPLSDPERDQPLGKINLEVLAKSDPDHPACYGTSGFVYGSTMFAHDHYVYLVWDDSYYSWEGNYPAGKTSVAVFDVQNAASPTLVARKDFDFRFDGWGWYDYYGSYGYGYGAMLSAGRKIVQRGSTLVMQESVFYTWDPATNSYAQPGAPSLRIIDLSNPANPALAATVPSPVGSGYSPLIVDGSIVHSSHYEEVTNTTKVRFFVDRWDISNPWAPEALSSINVPGSLVSVDQATNRLMTVDYERVVSTASTWEECYAAWGYNSAYFDYDASTCTGIRRHLRLLDVQGGQAGLLDTLQLEDGSYSNPAVGDDRVFLTKYPQYTWTSNGYEGDMRNYLVAIGGIADGKLTVAPKAALENQYWSYDSVFAYGKKAVAMGWYPGSLAVYDTTTLTSPPNQVKSVELNGYPQHMELVGDTAICSLGYNGVQAVSLSTP